MTAGGAYDDSTKQMRIIRNDAAALPERKQKEKTIIADEFIAATGYQRKYVIPILKRGPFRKMEKRKGRQAIYRGDLGTDMFAAAAHLFAVEYSPHLGRGDSATI